MSKVIEIKDRDADGGLAVELGHLLSLLEKKGPNLMWSVLDLYTMGYTEENTDMIELEQRFAQESGGEGFPISWPALLNLAKSCRQIIDTVIVAYKNPSYRPILSPTHPVKTLYNQSEIVLELIDGSVWYVFSLDDEFIERLAHEFRDINVITSKEGI